MDMKQIFQSNVLFTKSKRFHRQKKIFHRIQNLFRARVRRTRGRAECATRNAASNRGCEKKCFASRKVLRNFVHRREVVGIIAPEM